MASVVKRCVWRSDVGANTVKLLLPDLDHSAHPEGRIATLHPDAFCRALFLSKLHAEQHARGQTQQHTLYTNSNVIEANWSFPKSMFPLKVRGPIQMSELNQSVIVNDREIDRSSFGE